MLLPFAALTNWTISLSRYLLEKHDGKLPAEHSFLQAKADNVIVTAAKKAEDNNALILRFYEWSGKQGDVAIQLPQGATSVSETDRMEKQLGNLPVANGEVKVPTKPYEIKTIASAIL